MARELKIKAYQASSSVLPSKIQNFGTQRLLAVLYCPDSCVLIVENIGKLPKFVTADPVLCTNINYQAKMPASSICGIMTEMYMVCLQSGTGSSSIFGGAKPVDTAAREKEIEERLLKDQQLQKERKEVSSASHQ